MSLQKNYIELLKKFPKRIFSMEETDISAKDENRISKNNVSQTDEFEKK